MEEKHKAKLTQRINRITESYLRVRSDWETFNESFVAGSVGGPSPHRITLCTKI